MTDVEKSILDRIITIWSGSGEDGDEIRECGQHLMPLPCTEKELVEEFMQQFGLALYTSVSEFSFGCIANVESAAQQMNILNGKNWIPTSDIINHWLTVYKHAEPIDLSAYWTTLT